MRLITFSGGLGCGKSTAIKEIQNWAKGRRVVLVKFAQPLYDMQEFIYDRIAAVHKRPDGFVKDRKLLQWIGTDWGREKNVNLWVELWKAEVKAYLSLPDTIVVCDDVRFDNEAETVRAMGGIVIKLQRDTAAQHAVGGVGIKGHASESGIDPQLVEYILENNGSLEEFEDSLSFLFEKLDIGSDNNAEHA